MPRYETSEEPGPGGRRRTKSFELKTATEYLLFDIRQSLKRIEAWLGVKPGPPRPQDRGVSGGDRNGT